MSWLPPIRCIGRVYPGAPVYAKTGCIKRTPPFWFVTGSTGQIFWPPPGQKLPIRYEGVTETVSGFEPINTWRYGPEPGNGELSIWLFIERALVGWSINIRITKQPGPGDFAAWWRLQVPTGFSDWPEFIIMPLFIDGGGWPGGAAPAFWTVQRGDYAVIAPGSCVLP